MYRKRNFKTKDNEVIKGRKFFDNGVPEKEVTNNKSILYNAKAFRDLQNVGNIEVKADPNASVEKGSYPYNIIARSNRVIDAKYAGYQNIEGNILTRLQNSNVSQLNNYFDILTINLRLNYLYLCYKTNETTKHNNVAVNKEMVKAFNEALSKAYSTMTTQLPYYVDTIEAPEAPSIAEFTSAENSIYGKMMGLLHYQTVLQNAVAPLSKYIETMSLYQHALNMSYRREAPIVNALYGLLKKKAFLATLNSVGTSIIGEYFDDNWYKQMNLLAFTPSRKSDSVVDPLETASVTTLIPRVTFTALGAHTAYYDSNNLQAEGIWLNPDTFEFDGTIESKVTIKFEEIIYRLVRLLDVSTILKWARQVNTDPTSLGGLTTPSAYYQQIVKLIEQVNMLLTKFSTAMTDVRTFIDKLDNSGMVYWKKGMVINVNDIVDINPPYNVILHNVINQYAGGSASMTFDSQTQRWQASTLWNKYEGVAEFDKYSGGSFLTFGLRNITQGDLSNTDTAMCLPIMFASELETGYSKALAINRKGLMVPITGATAYPSDYSGLIRLDPLNVGFQIKIPTIDVNALNISDATEKSKCISVAEHLLSNVFGYGRIKTGSTTYQSFADPDYVCFLDVQIEDVSNEMIQFCRNYSPFRVSTPDGKRTIGFGW